MNRKLHRYAGLVVSLFLIMWAVTGFLLLNVPWYQEEATDLQHTKIEVPANQADWTLSYIGTQLVATGEYTWEEIRSVSKSGDKFKVYVSRDPILRLTIDHTGQIQALKQSPILDLLYGLHVGEWENLQYVTLLEVISVLTVVLVLTGYVYFFPLRRRMKKKQEKTE